MRYVAYFQNGMVYSGGPRWSLAETTERAKACAARMSTNPRLIAVIGYKRNS